MGYFVQSSTQLTKFSAIIPRYTNFLFDCDGVLWNSSGKTLPGAFACLNYLNSLGKRVFFISNNCMRSRRVIKERLEGFGYSQAREADILLSSSLMVQQMKPHVRKAYLIGQSGLAEELTLQGIPFVDGRVEHGGRRVDNHQEIKEMIIDEQIDAVVVGFCYDINFYMMSYASLVLQRDQRNAKLFASELTKMIKFSNGRFMPSVGAMSTAITEGLLEKFPLIQVFQPVSKPNPFAFETLQKEFGIKNHETIMIGDNIFTDLTMAKNADIDSLLVLTGEATINDLDKLNVLGEEYLNSRNVFVSHSLEL